jgi:predicted AlkP superfamily pyrophosphatase or phosphodiesterase
MAGDKVQKQSSWIWMLVFVVCLFISNALLSPIAKTSLILISLDGARPEYLTRGLTPTLQMLMDTGLHPEGAEMLPAFPTITFPNHYTLVTGLYPESHGIVGNAFYDPLLNDSFKYADQSKNEESKWWGGEPVWITAVKQGYKSAVYHWPGSEAANQVFDTNLGLPTNLRLLV